MIFNKNIHNNILKVSDHTKEHKVVYVETNSEINDKKTYQRSLLDVSLYVIPITSINLYLPHVIHKETMAYITCIGFPDGSVDKESACNVGDKRDTGLTPG